ncbi:MAG: flagellar protein FlaG [Caulobacterales bacterium]|nr:flagellar protein FlaG [Caulobacterales bacterium]
MSTDLEHAIVPIASIVAEREPARLKSGDDAEGAQAAPASSASSGPKAVREVEEPERVDRVRRKAQELFDRLTDGAMRPYARLSLDKDEETGTPIYKVIDSRNGDVIRQWPLEEALAIARSFNESEGLVVDRRV